MEADVKGGHAACRLGLVLTRDQQEAAMKANEVMTKNPSAVSPEQIVREAAQIMKRENVGIVPVVEGEGRLVGVVTDRDIAIRCIADGKNGDCLVHDVMSAGEIVTCNPDDDLDNVMKCMGQEQVRRIPIVDERGMLLGIVSQADVVRKAHERAEPAVEKISAPTRRHSQ
jgi:CBS domain-containing protein